MGEAIEMTSRLYPCLLEHNQNLLFLLKCRQFVEMVNGCDSEVCSTVCDWLNAIAILFLFVYSSIICLSSYQVNPPRCPRVNHASTPPRPSSPPPSSPAQTSSKNHAKGQAQRRNPHSTHSVEDMNMANSGVAMNGGVDVSPLIKPDSHGNYLIFNIVMIVEIPLNIHLIEL